MVLAEVKVDNIYIVCGYTDMRKSTTGLSTIIVQQFGMRPPYAVQGAYWLPLPMATQCKRGSGSDRAAVSSSFRRFGNRAETISAAERFSIKNLEKPKGLLASVSNI